MSAVFSPVQKMHNESFTTIGFYWKRYLWLLDVQKERDDLLQRMKALEAQNSKLGEYQAENQRLRVLLSFPERTNAHRLAAAVIGRDPSNWIKSITIDRGRDDLVQEGLPVVDGNAVVGQVIMASRKSARVLLLADQGSAIDALVQNSRAPGIVEGTPDGSLKLRYLEKDSTVSVGDRIIASGVDGIFPKGVLIGVVTKVEDDSGSLFKRVEVSPSADLKRLENVLVLIPKAS